MSGIAEAINYVPIPEPDYHIPKCAWCGAEDEEIIVATGKRAALRIAQALPGLGITRWCNVDHHQLWLDRRALSHEASIWC